MQNKKRGPGRPPKQKDQFFKVSSAEWSPPSKGRKKPELHTKVIGLAESLKQKQWFDVPQKEASQTLLRSWLKELEHISLHQIRDMDGKPVATRIYFKA